jgi:hypothetical protein
MSTIELVEVYDTRDLTRKELVVVAAIEGGPAVEALDSIDRRDGRKPAPPNPNLKKGANASPFNSA